MTTDKEFEAFRAMMLSQFARLAENAGRYIGRMSNYSRELVLERALDYAWTRGSFYNPAKSQLAWYWDACLRNAVWSLEFVHLRHTADWETLPVEVFLTRIPAVGVPSDE